MENKETTDSTKHLTNVSIKKLAKDLDLKVMYKGCEVCSANVESSSVNRPGLQLAGFFDYFAINRIQVMGKVEITYLEGLSSKKREEVLEKYFSYDIPCLILARGLPAPEGMVKIAKKYKRILLRGDDVTTKLTHKIMLWLDEETAPKETIHGVLLDVYGVGVLLIGESGIGKSESALELLKRGHRLVADDAVELSRISDSGISGTSPNIIRHFMELRGVGIIDIRNMYGIGAVMDTKEVDLIIEMEYWDKEKEYDRLGIDQITMNILGIEIPKIVLPVKPGRNLAIVIEAAARNTRAKEMGYHAACELDAKIDKAIEEEEI